MRVEKDLEFFPFKVSTTNVCMFQILLETESTSSLFISYTLTEECTAHAWSVMQLVQYREGQKDPHFFFGRDKKKNTYLFAPLCTLYDNE